MRKTKFSIIVPAHNEEDVIERAIKSVQNQTFKDFEIIVSNDGSTDKTREIVEGLTKKDKRIKILNRNKGHSAAYARNRGAEIAKGEILVFLDADTYLGKELLKKINNVSKKADAFAFHCLPVSTSFMSKVLSAFVGKSRDLKEKQYTKKDKEKPLFFCYKNKIYNKIKGYNENIFYYEDEELVNKIYTCEGKVFFINYTGQFYELPSTFKEFTRQCKWIGKGTNSITDRRRKIKHIFIWFGKFIFLISPLFFLSKPKLALGIFVFTFLISYIILVFRNKQAILSLLAMPFLYIKTFLVSFNIIKHSKDFYLRK